MAAARQGDTVRIHYTGRFPDGTPFDSSDGRDPLEFTLGSGQIIPGLDNAVQGMSVGETRSVEVPADQAYGQHDPNGRQAVPRAQVPEHVPLDIGTRLQLQDPSGRTIPVTVAEVTDEAVVLDANHPLAGRDLVFEVELVEIR
jgi:FKBP-type peptidyl-prolyl cis-trans isomerase 2